MSKRLKRTSLEIMYSILSACNNNSTKTRIMYNAGINLIELTKYLELLEKEGYIKKVQSEKRVTYSLTEKGRDALVRLEKYIKIVKELEEAKKDVIDLIKIVKKKKEAKT
ncbi:DUF4364 family protein [Sulfurisphaera ohwakuensis]|uniref:DUF4364 family protein n=1 Tax=Sulfurisphaera ohwakuensis TaxID=69656 RepID=UPI0036F2B13C